AGTVLATVAAGVAHDTNGTPNAASTSTDNSVTYSTTPLLSQNERFVAQVYLDVLQRPVGPTGVAFWSGRLAQGVARSQLVLEVEASGEYRALVVQALYAKFLRRAADPSGLSTFVNLLGSGGTVEQLEAALSGSAEYFQNRGGGTNDGFLAALYQDALGRPLDG